MEIDIDKVARAIRDAYDKQSREKGYGPLTPWDNMPDARKNKWRLMAKAAIAIIKEEER